ncbi:MAG TPA: 1-deoxy-D-xylulose-5-phosphate reductoisomerase [Candidatus Limnocylindrales bacterium]|nr:1-deoxy-D-xylulose-5-phosphate reductoisomerase [Candidatus Limnocylindrales bacterium]
MTGPWAAGGAEGRTGVAVLGSSGSIGRQTLDVLERLADRFAVVALATGHDAAGLAAQAERFRPAATSLTARDGEEALVELATRADVDLVVVATSGLVSLRPVLAALEAGKVVATANKETLVAGGHLVMPRAVALARAVAVDPGRGPDHPLARPLGWLRPIDSEHSAIWQCLAGESRASIDRFVLTASGGPFRSAPADLTEVTPAEALAHPTWRMGPKVTVDSATLMNKGLEVIEAHWLYDAAYERIDVVIHPQSVVHSAVVFRDGSLKAQLGPPDMHLPIQYALTYPDRAASPGSGFDLAGLSRLDFGAPDTERFPALRIAREAGEQGPWASAALICADEVAVSRFLEGRLSFPGIPRLVEAAVDRFGRSGEGSPDAAALVALEAEVRAFGSAWVGEGSR